VAAMGGVRDDLWEAVDRSSAQEKEKKEENELAISLRTRSVTHLAGPPTSRVPPWYVAPHPTEICRPTSLRRGEGLAAAVPGRREREERDAEVEVVVGYKRAQNGNRSGVTCGDMRPKSPPPSLVVVLALGHNAWSLTPASFGLRTVGSLTPALRTASYLEHHWDPGAIG